MTQSIRFVNIISVCSRPPGSLTSLYTKIDKRGDHINNLCSIIWFTPPGDFQTGNVRVRSASEKRNLIVYIYAVIDGISKTFLYS